MAALGLFSRLGGEDVIPLEFTGNEEQVIAIQGPTTIYNYGGPNSRSAWQSQPASSGYVRGNQTSGSGTSEADFNSGTPDGDPGEELENVANFEGGSPQNPSADQPAPTSRAQQNAASNESGSDGTSASDTSATTGGIQAQGLFELPSRKLPSIDQILPPGGPGMSGTFIGGGVIPDTGQMGSPGFGPPNVPGMGGPNGGVWTDQRRAQDHGTTQDGQGGFRGGPGKYSTWNTPQASPPPATPGNPGSPPSASPSQSPLNGGVPAQGSQTPIPGPGQPAPTGGGPSTPAQGNAGLTQSSPGQAQAVSSDMAAITAYMGSGENPPSTASSSVAIYSVGMPTIRCMACHSGYAAGLIEYSNLTPSAKNAIFMAGAQPSVGGHLNELLNDPVTVRLAGAGRMVGGLSVFASMAATSEAPPVSLGIGLAAGTWAADQFATGYKEFSTDTPQSSLGAGVLQAGLGKGLLGQLAGAAYDILGGAGILVAGSRALGSASETMAGAAPSSGAALENANFAQRTFSRTFSAEGSFAGRTVGDVAADLRSGVLNASDVPVQYIVRDGNTLMLNTRSAQALEQAGIPRAQWNAVNVTGDAEAEARLTRQLGRNGLPSQGTPTVRPSGGN